MDAHKRSLLPAIRRIGNHPTTFLDRRTDCRAISLSVVLKEAISRSKQGFYFLAVLIEYLFIGIGSVWSTTITSYRFAFLPDAFYHPILAAPNLIYFAWVCLPLSLIGAFVYPKGKNQSKKRAYRSIHPNPIPLLGNDSTV